MYIEQLREMIPPPNQNTVAVCNQTTLLIPYYIKSRLVTRLKKINVVPIRVSDIFYLAVSFKFIYFSFQISLSFVLKCLLASCLTVFGLSTFLLFGSCNHCILAWFLWSKKSKHSSSNHGLCCFNSYRPRLSLAEIVTFSLMFSQALFMSSLSLKFSKAANRFEILNC